jgi:acyl-CoA reductase-like NAD-dependent aldehyde dehydrogenase
LSLAAEKIIEGSLKYSGQRCDAISRVLVVEKIHKQFVSELLNKFNTKHIDIVPLINEDASKRVMELINDAVANGATILTGGKSNKNFVEATILDNVPLLAKIAWEETFGPVITIIPVKDANEAIKIAKESEFGLDSCIFGKRNVVKYAKMLDDGSVTINNYPSHGVGYYPFGGNKNSGIGREGIGYSLAEMTRIKTIKK